MTVAATSAKAASVSGYEAEGELHIVQNWYEEFRDREQDYR